MASEKARKLRFRSGSVNSRHPMSGESACRCGSGISPWMAISTMPTRPPTANTAAYT